MTTPEKKYSSPAERRSAKEKRRKQYGARKIKNDTKKNASAAIGTESAISFTKIRQGARPRDCVKTICCFEENSDGRFYYAAEWDKWFRTCINERGRVTCPYCRRNIESCQVIRFTIKGKKKRKSVKGITNVSALDSEQH